MPVSSVGIGIGAGIGIWHWCWRWHPTLALALASGVGVGVVVGVGDVAALSDVGDGRLEVGGWHWLVIGVASGCWCSTW